MKAATKFKKLIAKRRPGIMESILGGSEPPHLVEPPLPMANHPHLAHKSKSVETYDRRPVERILVSEGVHREVDVNNLNKAYSPRKIDPELHVSTKSLDSRLKENSYGSTKEGQEEPPNRDVTASPDSMLPLSHSTTLHSPHSWEQEGNRGHAHNPLEEQLYLHIGASSMADASNQEDDEDFSNDQNMVVSESPGAAEGNIYETAYREEIERIRSKSGHDTTVYLTRRVEGKEAVKDMGKLLGGLLAGKTAQTGKDESSESENSGKDKSLPVKGFSDVVGKVAASGKAEPDHVKSKEEHQSETQMEPQEIDEEDSAPQDGNKTPEVLPEPTSAPAESTPQSSMSKMRKFSRGGFKGLLGKMKGPAR
jgi:calcium/calmodulin-dependent protein kinase kinase 2